MKLILSFLLVFGAKAFGAASTQVRNFLGPNAVRVLEKAERVESFRVSSDDKIEGDAPDRIGGYKVTGTGKGKVKPKELTSILLDEKTYEFETAKRCVFKPGVAFRFWLAKESIDVLLCFSCDELEVIAAGHRATEDFDRARPRLVKLAKKAFPSDKEIGGLSGPRP